MCHFSTFLYSITGWLLSILLHYLTLAQGQSDFTTPIEWSFNTTFFAGPDGPWPVVNVLMAWPYEVVSMFPGRNLATLVISSRACSQQGAKCSNPGASFYGRTPLVAATTNYLDVSTDNVPGWDPNLVKPMQVHGPVRHTVERITVLAQDGAEQYLDNLSTIISDGMATRYAEGIQITLDIGILSLNHGLDLAPSRSGSSGSNSFETYTPLFYLGKNITPETPISSQSWGLHMGSAQYNVSGSLFFGGYDQTRVLGAPGIFDTSVLALTGISINSTIHAFPSTQNLLNTVNSSAFSGGLSIVAEPGLPYLYLPAAICTSIASSLPLNYNADLQLYTWDLSHPSLLKLLTSLSSLQFTFTNNSGTSTNIPIPLALLNLTLTPPLVPKLTPYFPCRPYSPENTSGVYYLGRAFLQGTFLGENTDSKTSFIAQAPGPNLQHPQIVSIGRADKSISAAVSTSAWEDTWAGILSIDGKDHVSQPNPNNSTSNLSYTPPSGNGFTRNTQVKISVGAKAGIGVSCGIFVIGVTLGAGLWLLRRKNRSKDEARLADERKGPTRRAHIWHKPELTGHGKVEVEAPRAMVVQEISATEDMVHEVNGSDIIHEIAPTGIPHEIDGHVRKIASRK